ATIMGKATTLDDFDAAVGLKADWTIDPTSGNDGAEDYIKPFTDHLKNVFPNFFERADGATLFDVTQRDESVLLSKITELYFAVTGGGFQYFYPENPELADVDQPMLAFETSNSLAGKENELKKITSVAGFISLCAAPEKLEAAYSEFRAAWDRVAGVFQTTSELDEINKTTIYIFSSKKLPLLPLVGSVVCCEKVEQENKQAGILIMVIEETDRTWFSLRGTSDDVHIGKLCGNLAERFVDKYGQPDQNSGGGHARAGECKTSDSIPYLEAKNMMLALIQEMRDLDNRRANWSEEDKVKAEYYGIERSLL
ncbi:MAG: hypothetical protein JKX97_01625, partial [Candidatus Lindowbacteria bacterium]|nr:hypothetical protein [Candidatus Lindowbacteria bacterium]